MHARSISGTHSPLHSDSHNVYRVGSRHSQSSLSSLQTARQNVSHKIHVSDEGLKESDYNWPVENCEEAQELEQSGREPEGVTF